MASVSILNPKADVLRKSAAFFANTNAAKGLMNLLKTNLGPRGTLKMLVGGAGQIKITKDGNVLLNEMQIQHPTASMIARASTAQDSIMGDGTTSTVIIMGELMRQAEMFFNKGIHPRVLCNGISEAKTFVIDLLDKFKIPVNPEDREILEAVARTSLKTKLPSTIAEQLTEIVVDAILCIKDKYKPYQLNSEVKSNPTDDIQEIDLFMIEILHMTQSLVTETRLVRGMVMDHGARHPDMPKKLTNCYVLTCNVSLEYERTEVHSGFFYSSAEQRAKLVDSERQFTDNKVLKIIELKNEVCTPENKMNFVVFNQKGIDPVSLDMLAREGIFALRRVKRRNMERLTLCCGGNPVNSVDDVSLDDLGYAGLVYEEGIGDERWTFVEDVKMKGSCCILVKGPNDHSINQIKDAIRDGLRAVKNTIEDKAVLPGAGAVEVAAYCHLQEHIRNNLRGKIKYGAQAFAESLLVIPKTLTENSGLDVEETVLELTERYEETKELYGLDIYTGKPTSPVTEGIFDNFSVKKHCLSLVPALAQQLLTVDEIIKAGKAMSNKQGM